jgi:ATP synthase protein I
MDENFNEEKKISEEIRAKETRKIKARREKDRGLWFGLGMFGLVGWSVVIPTLLGVGLGVWLDKLLQDRYSWTLMGLVVGIIAGCINAWYWVKKESGRD